MNVHTKVYIALLLITLFSYLRPGRKEFFSRMVVLLMILWLATTAVALYLIKYAGYKNNLFVFHISTPLEYIILALLYRNVIINTRIKKIITASIPVFIILSILFSLFVQRPDVNNSQIVVLESLIMIFLSLYFLREVLLLQQAKSISRFPMFWISVGILSYFTGNVVIEAMLNYLISHSPDLARNIYRTWHFFKYLLFTLFIIGAFCDRPLHKSILKNDNQKLL